MVFHASIFTLYPEMFPGSLGYSLAGEALTRADWRLSLHNIRDHGLGKHKRVDDTPSGGGAGMVLRADVLAAALDHVIEQDDSRPRLLMSPRGQPFTQDLARQWSKGEGVIIVCGRFEGVDERIIAGRNLREISIGDYVLSGGEPAALVILDSCVRLLNGVMGAPTSGDEESFESGLLEYPQYTRPREWEGQHIPDVLNKGNHAEIRRWRHEKALELTRQRRPDLIKA